MPIEIANTTGQKNFENIESVQAQKTLGSIASIHGKSGVLKLMHTTDNSRNMTFERKSWWQFWARRDSKMNVTAECLKTLFKKAYNTDKTENVTIKDKYWGFEAFLKEKKNRVTAKDVQIFVGLFEQASENKRDLAPQQKPDFQAVKACTIPKKFTVSKGRTIEQVLNQHLMHGSSLVQLGTGRFTTTYKIQDRNGNFMALKGLPPNNINSNLGKVTTDTLRNGELVGFRLKETPGVAKPTAIVLQNGTRPTEFQYIPLEPYKEAKAYLKSLAESGTDWRVAAVAMPLAQGEELEKIASGLSTSDRQAIAKQGVATLSAMHRRGIVHRDIRPANQFYDKDTQKSTYIDFGFCAKIHSGDGVGTASPLDIMGTDLYVHPSKGSIDNYIGPEQDMYSFAMTQLELATGGSKQFLQGLAYTKFDNYSNGNYWERDEFTTYKSNHSGNSYLRNLLEYNLEILPPANNPKGKEALEKLNKDDPEMKFIEQAFEVAMKKPDSDKDTRKEIFSQYYEALEKLESNDYLNKKIQ